MSMQYGYWNNKYYVLDGSKIYIYPNDNRVVSVLLLDYKIDYLIKELDKLRVKIEKNKIIRNINYCGSVLTLGGAVILYSNNKSLITFISSCVLGLIAISFGTKGISKHLEVYYDNVTKDVIRERLNSEKESLQLCKKECLCKNFDVKRIESKLIIDNLECELSEGVENKLHSRSLIKRLSNNTR